MGVRMFTTARLMETWAHGQEVYDLMGVARAPTDRLLHIATIGVKTFGWTFANRRQEPPGPPPIVDSAGAPSAGVPYEPSPTTVSMRLVDASMRRTRGLEASVKNRLPAASNFRPSSSKPCVIS